MRFIGQTHLVLGNHEQARQALEAAEVIASELGGGRLIAQTRYWTGQACLATGDLDGAQAAFDAVLDLAGGEAGIGRAYALHGLGDLAQCRGDYSLAEQHLAEAGDLAREGEDAFLEGRVWLSTAALHRVQQQPSEQIKALEQAVAVFAGSGVPYLEARALAELAQVTAGQGDTTTADAAWARIAGLYDTAGLPQEDRLYRRPAF
jgi:tetratricopeptide (TPR) repeat protein